MARGRAFLLREYVMWENNINTLTPFIVPLSSLLNQVTEFFRQILYYWQESYDQTNRITEAEDRISELEDRMVEIKESERIIIS